MKLSIETWLQSQQLDQESQSCFEESFVCFKVGAYKAALLFSYLGFSGIIRTRILGAAAPTGFQAPYWISLQNKVRDAEAWDKSVFDAIQQQKPGQVFIITQDLRDQVSYWKDRRNDCAHSKNNKIVAAHVESFYAFIESNLGKFAVNGSRPAITARILNHFNPSLTAPNQPFDAIIQEISHAVPQNELNDFFNELCLEFDNRRNTIEIHLSQQSTNKLVFFEGCFRRGNNDLKLSCLEYLKANKDALLSYFRRNPNDVYLLKGNSEEIRQLWHDHLFVESHDDFPLFTALLRNNLVPQDQLEEALAHLAKRTLSHVPNDFDNPVLIEKGFYKAFEKVMVSPGFLGSFEWGNGSKALIIKFLSDNPISRNVAQAIYEAFDGLYSPWHLKTYLIEFFQANPLKKQEYETFLGGNPFIGRPSHITSLAASP